MAKKKVAQERCLFCDEFPCKCSVIPASKLLREKHQGGNNVKMVGQPEPEPTGPDEEAERTDPGPPE